MTMLPMEDRVAIEDLVKQYSFYCDTRQFEKLFNLFAEESIFDETSAGAKKRATSRAEMRALFHEAGDALGPSMHTCSNHLISALSDGAASGTCHVLAEGVFNVKGEGQTFRIFGYYDDRYERSSDGRWYFKSRTLKLLVPSQGAAPTVGGITYD